MYKLCCDYEFSCRFSKVIIRVEIIPTVVVEVFLIGREHVILFVMQCPCGHI